MKQLSLGGVAGRALLRISATRYDEGIGLIPEPRRERGQCGSGPDVVTHLAQRSELRGRPFTLQEIRTPVTGFPAETPTGGRRRALARRELPEVDAPIAPTA
jgi:hypothetical protein